VRVAAAVALVAKLVARSDVDLVAALVPGSEWKPLGML